MKPKVIVATVGLLFVVVLAAILLKPRPGPQAIVGVILSQTGSADFIGKPEAAVLAELEKQDKGLPFELEIKDSGGSVDHALTIFDEFRKNPNVIAVIGPSTSGESIAVAKEAEKHHIPLLSLAASKKIVTKPDAKPGAPAPAWAFKFAQNDDLAANRLVAAMKAEGNASVALLYSNDGFGKSGASVARAAINDASGLTLVHDVPFPPLLDRADSLASSVPNAVDAILIWGTSPGPASLVKALARRDHPAQVYLSHGNASPSFIAATGTAAEGAILVGSRILKPSLSKEDPRDLVLIEYGQFWINGPFTGRPSQFGGYARDAFGVLSQLTRGGALSRQAIRDELESMPIYVGVTGNFDFEFDDHAGLTSDAFETYIIQSGTFKVWVP